MNMLLLLVLVLLLLLLVLLLVLLLMLLMFSTSCLSQAILRKPPLFKCGAHRFARQLILHRKIHVLRPSRRDKHVLCSCLFLFCCFCLK